LTIQKQIGVSNFRCFNGSSELCDDIKRDLESNLAAKIINFESSGPFDNIHALRLLNGLVKTMNEFVKRDGNAESVLMSLNHTSSNFNFLVNCVDTFV
jgi:hypothetical protein